LDEELRRRGWEVIGTQSSPARGRTCFRLECDRYPDVFRDLPPPAVAFLCAAISDVDRVHREIEHSARVNVTGTVQLIDDLIQRGVKPVFFSSDYVFSGTRGGYVEEDAPDPVNDYGRQKVLVEDAIRRTGAAALVIRMSRILTDNPHNASLLSSWHRSWRAGHVIRCSADQRFCPTSARDVARGVLRLVDMGEVGLYHLCAPTRYDRATLLREFAEALALEGLKCETVPDTALGFTDRRPADTSMNPAKFLSKTGLRMTSMQEVFARFADALREFPGLGGSGGA
jgi:dTDP-4-dehydrorhamnose reductase